jgi:hypothetical protein
MPAYAVIANYLAFYASRVDECWATTNLFGRRLVIFTVVGSRPV